MGEEVVIHRRRIADEGWSGCIFCARGAAMNVMGLVQLCEAAQPAGGYGYALGIERLARGGKLRAAAELEDVLAEVLRGAIGPADGVASGVTFRAARGGEFEQIPEVCAAL